MRYIGMMPLFWACTGENVLDKQDNSAPTVLIGSHSDGAEVLDGYVEAFRATISDDDNEFSEITTAWYVGEEIVCDWAEVTPAGESFCDIVFAPDDTNVIIEARDAQGAGGRAEIAISVLPTEAPIVELLSPEGGQAYYSNQLIQFSGLVSDLEDNAEDLLIAWSSSVDGELSLNTTPDSAGLISDYTYLSEGQHAIELRVEDSSGKSSTAEVVLQVGGENSIPGCSISEPLSQSAVVVGDSVIFIGTASDVDIPNTELMVEWTSDKDGLLGTSTPSTAGAVNFAYSGLSAETHTISLNVSDEVGEVCSEQILLLVGNPPSAVIEDPLDGDIFAVNESVVFRAAVSDQEDQPNEISVEWASSLDGSIYSAVANSQGIAQFSSSTLSAGLHTISVTAIDSSGLIADDLISIRVNTPPTAPSVVLSPDPAHSIDTLMAMASGSSDDDGDNISYSYQWFENGILTALTGSVVSASELDIGELWTVRVTPNDGWVDGNYTEASMSIINSEPVISVHTITPSSGIYNDTSLNCQASVTDADQTVTPTYQWTLPSGTAFGSSINLSSYAISPGDSVECLVAANDGYTIVFDSISVLVENRAPVVSSVSISSSDSSGSAYYDSVLTCSMTVSDADNETTLDTYQWERNGVVVASSAELDLNTQTVSVGDTVECLATAADGVGDSDSAAASTTIGNAAPIIDSLSLVPSSPSLTDTVVCSASATDPEGETLSYSFAFSNQTTGASYSATTVNTMSASLDLTSISISSNDTLVCELSVTDLTGASTTDQALITVANTSPVFISPATIVPNTGVYTGTTLTCSAIAVDANLNLMTSTYTWGLNGFLLASGATYTIDPNQTDVWDTIVCTATAANSGGTTTSTDSVTVDNTPASISNVSISGVNGLYNDQQLSCSAIVSDPDDLVTPIYTWSSNGGILGYGTSFDLATTSVMPNDPITCTVDVNDGFALSQDSVTEMVENRAPSTSSVSITWSGSGSTPMAGESLTCVGSGSLDPDGSSVSYSYDWTSMSGATVSGTTVAGSSVLANETWTCQVIASDGSLSSSATDSVLVGTSWIGDRSFSTCTQTGATGPSQSQCDSAYSVTSLNGEVTVSSGAQSWIVPATGTYLIDAYGSRGGNKSSGTGGSGAWIEGEFALNAGDVLVIHVGQKGRDFPGSASTEGSGGGGGTFVFLNGNPLVIAGGGGGTSYQGNSGTGGSATASSAGGGYGTNSSGDGGGSGNNGGGGTGGGGGGLYSAGTGNSWTVGGSAAGGNGGDSSYSIWGGFGGGGGSYHGGGGGGGYSGGGGGMYSIGGGGAGSYNSGTNPVNTANYNFDDGSVVISIP